MHRHAKQARVHDRTSYTSRVRKNFVPHHTQKISLAVVKGEGDSVKATSKPPRAASRRSKSIRDSLNPPGA